MTALSPDVAASKAIALIGAGIFDTYMVYERAGTWFVAGGCTASITLDRNEIRIRHGKIRERRAWESTPVAALGAALHDLSIPRWRVYGWLTFETAHLIAGRRDAAGAGEHAHLIVPRAEIRIDADGASIDCPEPQLVEQIRKVLAAAVPEPLLGARTTAIDDGGDWYRQAVAETVAEIRRGSLDKIVLSRVVPVDAEIDLPRTYLLGRCANTPARSFLLDVGGRRAAGFCPETILEADGDGIVSTQPLAGTRSFGNGSDADRRLRAELLADPKEVYEHAISVKLAYDELTRCCGAGSVQVHDFMSVSHRGSVQHLASRVRGRLAPNRTAWDALEVVFPAITASGAPKQSAVEYITRTERQPRGLYAGGVLRAGYDGTLDVGLVLRSIFQEDARCWLRAGAGIVAASRPEREYQETCEKLRSIAPWLVEAPGHTGASPDVAPVADRRPCR